MANVKISALPAASAIIATDIFPIVDDPGGTPVTQKATFAQLAALLNPEIVVFKPASTIRASNAVAAPDPDLIFPALAAGTYTLDGYIAFISSNAAGYKHSMFAASAPDTSSVGYLEISDAGVMGACNTEAIRTASGGIAATVPGANAMSINVRGYLVLPSAIDISWQWAQQSSGVTNTTTLRGSWLRVRKVA